MKILFQAFADLDRYTGHAGCDAGIPLGHTWRRARTGFPGEIPERVAPIRNGICSNIRVRVDYLM
ncbi:MAG TPA: hypothetical protein VL793_04380 [Patescibacteria group bacterium]|nr:hypothetical protein [Patescibacteria group bacterium]